MGKKTVSSSVFSGVKSAITPKLNVSKFSFVSPFQKLKTPEELRVEKTSSESQKDIAVSLNETNRILVEIQKQLALDFANRIAERKQNLIAAKKKIRKTKLVEKEAFVERGIPKETGNILNSKVFSPIKGIFDKILEFLALVGTGIVISNAWDWLSKKENREKLIKIFQFLREHWEKILLTLIGIKLAGAIGKFIGFADRLRKIFKALRGLKGIKGIKGQGKCNCKPGIPDFCNQVMECVKKKAGVAVTSIAAALVAGGFILSRGNLSGVLKLLSILGLGTALQNMPAFGDEGPPIMDTSKGDSREKINDYLRKTRPDLFADPVTIPFTKIPLDPNQRGPNATDKLFDSLNLPKWSIPIVESLLQAVAMRAGGIRIPMGMRKPSIPTTTRPPANLGSSLSSPISPQARRTGADFSVTDGKPSGVNLDAGASSPLTRFSRGSNVSIDTPTRRSPYESYQQGPKITPKKVRIDSNNIDAQIRDFGWRPKGEPQVRDPNNIYNPADMMGSKERLLKIYRGEGTNAADQGNDLLRWSARRLLNKPVNNGGFGLDLPKVQNMSDMIKKNLTFTNSGQLTKESRELLKNIGYEGTGLALGGFTGLLPGMPSMTDTIPAMLARGEFVVNSLSTKLFRPFLHFINDNAGKIFLELVKSINKLKENTLREEEITKKYQREFKDLSDYMKELKDREDKKKLKKILDENKGGGNSDSYRTVRKVVTPNKKQVPTKIQTYKRGKGGGTDRPPTLGMNARERTQHNASNASNVTVINMSKPAINLAGQQTPDPPTTSSVSSSPAITISPIDMSNEYNVEFFRLYEIV